jgi:hypothetical protein
MARPQRKFGHFAGDKLNVVQNLCAVKKHNEIQTAVSTACATTKQ